MKPRSPFDTLTPEDRERVLALCEQHSYDEVLQIIAPPRSDGGLGLQSSPSALCRFYVRNHALPHRLIVDAQLAEALDETFFDYGDQFFRAAIALMQQRVFNALSEGQTIEEVTPALRLTLSLRRQYLQTLQLRAKNSRPLDPIPEKYFYDEEDDSAAAGSARESPVRPSPPPDPAETAAAPAPIPAPLPAVSAEIACNSTNSTNSTNSAKPGRPADDLRGPLASRLGYNPVFSRRTAQCL